MKKGVLKACYPKDFPIDKVMESAKEIGYDGVELPFDPFELTKKGIEEFKEKLASFELALSGFDLLVSPNLSYPSLATPNEILRKKSIETIKKGCEVASEMGGKVFIINITTPVDISYRKIWEISKKSLLEIAPAAADTGIYIGVENYWNNFLYSPLEFKSFIDEINNEYVKVYFDVANCILCGPPQQWIEVLGRDIVCVHVKDFDTELDYIRLSSDFRARPHPSRPLLQGNIDWKAIVAALRKVGYDYFLNVEAKPYPGHPTKSAADNKAALDIILGT